MLQISCAVPVAKASEGFAEKFVQLGLKPIVTSVCIRVVYEGNDSKLVDTIIALYEQEPDHDIVVNRGEKKKGHKKLRS